jgi:hypothetical protein
MEFSCSGVQWYYAVATSAAGEPFLPGPIIVTIIMCVEQLVEWELAGEIIELLIENLPQCHFVHHDTYMTLAGIESRLPP